MMLEIIVLLAIVIVVCIGIIVFSCLIVAARAEEVQDEEE